MERGGVGPYISNCCAVLDPDARMVTVTVWLTVIKHWYIVSGYEIYWAEKGENNMPEGWIRIRIMIIVPKIDIFKKQV